MSERSEAVASRARQMVEELQRARDEIRVQLHLAGMEVRDTFERLEPKLVRFEARAHELGDEPVHELEESFKHLRSAFHKLREQIIL